MDKFNAISERLFGNWYVTPKLTWKYKDTKNAKLFKNYFTKLTLAFLACFNSFFFYSCFLFIFSWNKKLKKLKKKKPKLLEGNGI